jgi:tRNA/rRNA methyltransferase
MRIILIEPQEPGNIGSAARVMKNFGLNDLVLVRPQCTLTEEAFYMATHAKDIVQSAKIVASTAEALAGLKLVLGTTARKRTSEAFEVITPRVAATTYPREGLGVMFGPETSGLSNAELDYCQALVRIPTSEFASMNLAQAVNLISYEFFVSQVDAGKLRYPPELATRDEVERLYAHFLEMARAIGYTDAALESKTVHMYRRIFDRAGLTRREVDAMHGLWRQVLWALKHKRPGADTED